MTDRNERIRVRVNDTDPKRPFIIIEIGDSQIYLSGSGQECINQAQELTTALIDATNEAEVVMSHEELRLKLVEKEE